MMGPDDEMNDDYLLRALRRRLAAELEAKGSSPVVNNNIYGGGLGAGGGGGGGGYQGISEQMDPGAFDYMVDINKSDLFDEEDPTKRIGFSKQVHRYRTPKDRKKKVK